MAQFQLFSQLPTELRLEVWHLVAHQGRDLKMAVSDPGGSHNIGSQINISHSNTIPSLLHATQGSRQIVLGVYIDLFNEDNLSCYYFPCHFHVNPVVDFLCLMAVSDHSPSLVAIATCGPMVEYLEGGGMFAMTTTRRTPRVPRVWYEILKPGTFPRDPGTGSGSIWHGSEEVKNILGRIEMGGIKLLMWSTSREALS